MMGVDDNIGHTIVLQWTIAAQRLLVSSQTELRVVNLRSQVISRLIDDI